MKKFLSLFLSLVLFSSPLYAASTATCYGSDTKLMAFFNGADGATATTDSSTSANTFTANGGISLSTTSPKTGSAASLSTIAGASYWSLADSAVWDVGTANFTVDFFMKMTATTAQDSCIVDIGAGGGGSAKGISFVVTNTNNFHVDINGVQPITATAHSMSADTWYHWAIVRSGTTVTAYKDGTSMASGTSSADITGSTEGVRIQNGNTGYAGFYMNGRVDQLRFVNGTAVWTANFTAPSAEYTVCKNSPNYSYLID